MFKGNGVVFLLFLIEMSFTHPWQAFSYTKSMVPRARDMFSSKKNGPATRSIETPLFRAHGRLDRGGLGVPPRSSSSEA